MSPISEDPRKAERQLANLRKGGVPPAPVENQRAVKHGAYARVALDRIDAKVREVFDALADDAPLRATDGGLPAEDAAMVRLAAETMCRLDDVTGYLSAQGWMDAKGRPRTAILELEGRLRRETADHLDALGMSPRSRAKLGLDVAKTFDLAQALSERAGATDAR